MTIQDEYGGSVVKLDKLEFDYLASNLERLVVSNPVDLLLEGEKKEGEKDEQK